jgi:hypothetical protein
VKSRIFLAHSTRILPVLVVLSFLSIFTGPVSYGQQEPAPSPQEPTVAEDLGYGMGSVLASIFYSPAKVTYAGLGLITGGLGFVLTGGNKDVANQIIFPAVKGNYVVTPKHLQGIEPIYFVGPPPPLEEPLQPSSASLSTPQR